MLFALTAVMAMTFSMSETYKKQILKQRAKKHRVKPPPARPKKPFIETLKFWAGKTIKRPLHMLFTETIVTFFDLYIAVNFGLLNGFFAAFPYVFERVYGFDLGSVGLTFLGQAVGSIIGFLIVIYFDRYFYQPASRRCKEKDSAAKLPPEQRLYMAMMGAPMLPIS